jgi:hypothetical protein
MVNFDDFEAALGGGLHELLFGCKTLPKILFSLVIWEQI